jgi:hypothetical protein
MGQWRMDMSQLGRAESTLTVARWLGIQPPDQRSVVHGALRRTKNAFKLLL